MAAHHRSTGEHHGGSRKGSHHRGHPMSAETRARESAARKGKSHPHRGHKISAAQREKMNAGRHRRHHK